MARGTPDWVNIVQVAVTVKNIPVVPETGTESAICKVDYVSTSSSTYQTIVSWTVTADKVGKLSDVEMDTDNYSKTLFQLTIAGIQIFTGLRLLTALSLTFPDVELAEGQIVLLEAKSSDGTACNINGAIVGKEVG